VIDPDLLIESVTQATAEVFSMMLDMSIQFTGLATGDTSSENGLISLVGITGDWAGAGIFCCPPALAKTISMRMLGADLDPSVDEVMDVIAEVTNMVVGNIKNALEPITGALAISVPTVLHGRNFRFRNTTGLDYANLRFTSEGETFEVRVSLAPDQAPDMERAASSSKIPVLGMAHF
jgi:chemotaxis protein CheX